MFFSNVFKEVNWQKIEKSFGFGSVEISKVSAKTETSPKLLISAETETEIPVVHWFFRERVLSVAHKVSESK